MSWSESIPGLYQRPLGGIEAGLLMTLGKDPPRREFIKIHCVAHFEAPHTCKILAAALREAWKALRLLRSPDIATTFADGKKIYRVPSHEELEQWLDRTFEVTAIGTTVNNAVRARQARPSFLPSCALVPQSISDDTFRGSLVLFISHWRTEAAGAFMMINQLLDYAEDLLTGTQTQQALDNHVAGGEVSLLTPTLEDIVMPGREPSAEAVARVKGDFLRYYSKFPPLGFPMQNDVTAKSSYLKVNQRMYTPTSTSNLISACKVNAMTITAAIHAAYLGAVWSIAGSDSETRNYVSMMPAQVRTRLPPTSPYREQGCWDSARMLLLTAPPGQDMITRSRHLQQQYSRAGTDEWLYDDIRQIPVEMTSPPADLSTVPASLPWFTSIGLLDGDTIVPDHGSIKVDHLTLWADSEGPGIVLRLWTFRKSLNVQIQWNAAFHTDGVINKTLDLIEEALKQELGIEIEVESSEVEAYNE